MNTIRFLFSIWPWPTTALAVLSSAVILVLVRRFLRAQLGVALFGMALAVGILALFSPINALSQGYLFSAHVLQHLLLQLVVPPLILLALPACRTEARRGRQRWTDAILSRPIITWAAGLGAMWIWHESSLCNAASSSPLVHLVQIVSLLVLGAMFWWPIVGRRLDQRLSPPWDVAYLFSACLGCTLLGILITFSPVSVCPVYLHPTDHLGILRWLQQRGWTPEMDQQLGGLLMWVPACLVYLTGIMGVLARWYREEYWGEQIQATP